MFRVLGMLLLALAIPLGGCSTVNSIGSAYSAATSVKVTKTQVYVAANAFDAVEVTATNYVRLPTCKTGQTFLADQCSTKVAISKLVPAIRAGRAARNNLEAFAKDHPGEIGASGLYAALTTAISTIKTVLSAYGVAA